MRNKNKLTQRAANRLALLNAAALIQAADLYQLFGEESDILDNQDMLDTAQKKAVARIQALVSKKDPS
jgi:hypothetical protein